MATYRFKTVPDDFQREALIRALKHKKYGIFFQQRVGKTKTGIDFIGALHVAKGFKRALLLSPLSAVDVWKEQTPQHLGYPHVFKVLPQTEAARKKFIKQSVDELTVLSVTYDTLDSVWALLVAWKPEIVVMDEVHELKNPNSKRSKAAYKVVKHIDYRLGLTGTPIAKRPIDLFGVWKVINENLFGTRLPAFRNEYCIMGGFMGKEVIGYKDKEKMIALISENSMRVLRKDVMDEPEVTYETIYVNFEDSAKEVYKKLKKEFLVDIEASMASGESKRVTADIAGVRAMRLQQLCGGFLPSDDPEDEELIQVSKAKLKETARLIRRITKTGEKVVVFCKFIAELHELERVLVLNKITPLVIYGAVPRKDRTARVKQFQEDDDCKVIILQIRTGSMAICLDKAHINIYYSLSHRLLDFQQSRDRVMGRGQNHDVTNYFMAVKGTVDEKVIKVLQKDEDLASSMLDNWRWIFEDDEEG